MRSAVASNKLTDHEDWKDGMKVFRLRITEELTEITFLRWRRGSTVGAPKISCACIAVSIGIIHLVKL